MSPTLIRGCLLPRNRAPAPIPSGPAFLKSAPQDRCLGRESGADPPSQQSIHPKKGIGPHTQRAEVPQEQRGAFGVAKRVQAGARLAPARARPGGVLGVPPPGSELSSAEGVAMDQAHPRSLPQGTAGPRSAVVDLKDIHD